MFSCCRPSALHELDHPWLGRNENSPVLDTRQVAKGDIYSSREMLPMREKPSPACQLSQDLLAFALTVDTN